MIKLNPLTLVILNILFPVVIFLGKGIIYETICLLIAIVVLSIYKRYLQILKFIIWYISFSILAYLISISNIIWIADLFGTLVYIILRMTPVMMIAYILVKDIKSNELLSAFYRCTFLHLYFEWSCYIVLNYPAQVSGLLLAVGKLR